MFVSFGNCISFLVTALSICSGEPQHSSSLSQIRALFYQPFLYLWLKLIFKYFPIKLNVITLSSKIMWPEKDWSAAGGGYRGLTSFDFWKGHYMLHLCPAWVWYLLHRYLIFLWSCQSCDFSWRSTKCLKGITVVVTVIFFYFFDHCMNSRVRDWERLPLAEFFFSINVTAFSGHRTISTIDSNTFVTSLWFCSTVVSV